MDKKNNKKNQNILQSHHSQECSQKREIQYQEGKKSLSSRINEDSRAKINGERKKESTQQKNQESRAQSFSKQELRTLFELYDEYGPKWSCFQELMTRRNQNELKNKFHSTIRTLCRLIITASEQKNRFSSHISSSKISSKVLVDMYEGKKEFKKFQGFMKKMLVTLDYEIAYENVELSACRDALGEQIFLVIYNQLAKAIGRPCVTSQIKPKKVPVPKPSAEPKIEFQKDQPKNINLKKQEKESNIQKIDILTRPISQHSQGINIFNISEQKNLEQFQIQTTNQYNYYSSQIPPLIHELALGLERLNKNLRKLRYGG